MITMMVLLCYVNLSGMSLECIVIVLMKNSLLGGQECTDRVNVRQRGNNTIGRDRLAIIPRLNFTCNGRITGIRARVWLNDSRNQYPIFQVWRAASNGSTVYNRIGQIQLRSDSQVTRPNNGYRVANIVLTNNKIEVQSGDVIGYYHPLVPRYRVLTIPTDGYVLYQFSGSPESVSRSNIIQNDNNRQPLIQFTIGRCAFNQLKDS